MPNIMDAFLCKNKEMSWSRFESAAKEKEVFLYGLGYCAVQFFERYGNAIVVKGVIDNDICKQNFEIGDVLPEAFGTANEKTLIQSSRILNHVNPDNVVILIASSAKYQEIVCELEKKGFNDYYIVSLFQDFESDAGLKAAEKISMAVKEYCRHAVSSNKILFHTYGNYLDHEKYICNELLHQGQKLDFVWIVSDLNAELPSGIRKVLRSNWKKMVYEMETAHIWISDNSMPDYAVKRVGQVYIQTKHWASITLKKFYLDTIAFRDEPAKLALWKRESEIIDYIVVGSEFDKKSCIRGFQFNKEFIMAGSPRSDGLFCERENREKVFQYYGIEKDVRVLLYAPTYRFDRRKGKHAHQSQSGGFDYESVKNALEERFGGRWIIALRLHPSVKTTVKEDSIPSFVLDVSAYEDSEELVSAFDITVSDFSSIMFEPAFVKKPVFLYAADLEDYLENEYDILINYQELPFDIAENTKQLCDNILHFSESEYMERLNTFFERYGINEDGQASKRVAEFVLGLLEQ